MVMPSIFRRSPDETPEVEVHGQDVLIRQRADDDNLPADDVRVKLPKTKFA
jgi:hypothetical protein